MEDKILDVRKVSKIYKQKNSEVECEALKDINFSISSGEYVAIMGESGSGKTTLLNIISTLDIQTGGEVEIGNKTVKKMSNKAICRFRRENIGIVFQEFNLLDYFTLRENISFPLVLAGIKRKKIDEKVNELATNLGIGKLLEKYPYEVSGGEKQRGAIARALVCDPKIILADEPTGALDSKNSMQIMDIFKRINEGGQTIIMVTHSIIAASTANKVIFLKDGVIDNVLLKCSRDDNEFEKEIAQNLYQINNEGVRE